MLLSLFCWQNGTTGSTALTRVTRVMSCLLLSLAHEVYTELWSINCFPFYVVTKLACLYKITYSGWTRDHPLPPPLLRGVKINEETWKIHLILPSYSLPHTKIGKTSSTENARPNRDTQKVFLINSYFDGLYEIVQYNMMRLMIPCQIYFYL